MSYEFKLSLLPAPEGYHVEERSKTACAKLEPVIFPSVAEPESRNIDGRHTP
jgi:hypothetical protein